MTDEIKSTDRNVTPDAGLAMARTMADVARMAMDQGQEAVRLCLSTFAGANGPVAETTFAQTRQIMEQGGAMLAAARETVDRSFDEVQAGVNAGINLGRGLNLCQRAYFDGIRQTFERAADKPEKLMNAASPLEAVQIQRDLYADMTAGMMASVTAAMQALAQATQETLRPLQDRPRR